MAIRVRLTSPYGVLKPKTGPPIKNGRLGWTTGESSGRAQYIRFDRRKEPVAVPAHWFTYHAPRSRRAPRL